jgi:hypothetical protein
MGARFVDIHKLTKSIPVGAATCPNTAFRLLAGEYHYMDEKRLKAGDTRSVLARPLAEPIRKWSIQLKLLPMIDIPDVASGFAPDVRFTRRLASRLWREEALHFALLENT